MTSDPKPPALIGRRHFLKRAATGIIAAPMVAAAACAQQGGTPGESGGVVLGNNLPDRAVGRPMPKWASLPETPPVTPGDDRRAGFAIMGLGLFALGQIMPRLAKTERCRLAAIVSGNPDKARAVAAAYGLPENAIYSYDDFDRIADDPRVDVVYNILPNKLHPEWTERAFRAGKHVMCEKPMATTPEEAERMIAARDRYGKKLMIAYRAHFEPHNRKVVEMIKAGELGRLTSIQTNNHRMARLDDPADVWRLDLSLAGGGALPDYGLYGLNASYYLSGESPEEVTAFTTHPTEDPRFQEVEDLTTAQFRYPSGLIVQLASSYSSAHANDIHIVGSDAVLRMDPATGYGGNRVELRKGGKVEVTELGTSEQQFFGELDHMASAVLDDTPIVPDGEMGLRDMRLIAAIYTSAREGRPVKLNPDGTMKG